MNVSFFPGDISNSDQWLLRCTPAACKSWPAISISVKLTDLQPYSNDAYSCILKLAASVKDNPA